MTFGAASRHTDTRPPTQRRSQPPISRVTPISGLLDDIALQDDCVGRLYWYHSSPYENWPDAGAYASEFEAQIAKVPSLGGCNPQQLLEQHTSLAVHVGTYEAAIENVAPLRFPSALERKFPDAADPERQRIEAIAEQLHAYNSRREQTWAELTTTLESEYLPDEVNDQVHERFHDALAHTDDPVEYHRIFRLMAALLGRPHDVIAELAHAPVRTINNAGSQ